MLPLLRYRLFSLSKRGEIRLSWNRGGRRRCESQWGRIGMRICTLTKSRPTTRQRMRCASSLQPLSVSSPLKPTAGYLLSPLLAACLLSSQISSNLRPPQTPLCFLLNGFSLQQHFKSLQKILKKWLFIFFKSKSCDRRASFILFFYVGKDIRR